MRSAHRQSMTFLALLMAFGTLVMISRADHHEESEKHSSGWFDLFDGKSLDGWTQRFGTATYRVEDGTIVGKTSEGSPNSFLCTDKEYGDFELVFEVKVDNALNSGVQIRSNTHARSDGRVNGPQVEIAANGGGGSHSGYIFGESAGGWMTSDADRKFHRFFRNDEWNHYRVIAAGPRIQTWINGEMVSNLVHEEKFKTHAKGYIGLQVHSIKRGTGPFEVAWRNIKVREIDKDEVAAIADGYVNLLTGVDLSGWETTGNWLVQDDGSVMIKPRPGERGWQRYDMYLWTKRTYKDFILDLEYRYPPGGNSGVYFRVKDKKNPVETGIESQILDSSKKTGKMTHHDHGGIIRTQGASKNMSKAPNEWNRMIVTCKGNHLTVQLNGEQIIDLQLNEGAMKDRPMEGYIGLQDHGEPHNLVFRHIRIKEL